MWLGLRAGNLQDIFQFGLSLSVISAYAGVMPLVAGLLSCLVIVITLLNRNGSNVGFFGPLGFITLYGAIGVLSAIRSPDILYAFYWALLYLSVPLVVWCVARLPRNLECVAFVIKLNHLAILVAIVIFYVISLLYMDFGKTLVTPTAWFNCTELGEWFIQTTGKIRGTGVGRFAGLGVVLAIPGIFLGKPRFIWVIIGLASLLLLLSTGARTAFVSLAIAAPVTLYLCGGKRSVVILVTGLVGTFVFLFATGSDKGFLQCLLRGTGAPDPVHRLKTTGPNEVTLQDMGDRFNEASVLTQVSSLENGSDIVEGQKIVSDPIIPNSGKDISSSTRGSAEDIRTTIIAKEVPVDTGNNVVSIPNVTNIEDLNNGPLRDTIQIPAIVRELGAIASNERDLTVPPQGDGDFAEPPDDGKSIIERSDKVADYVGGFGSQRGTPSISDFKKEVIPLKKIEEVNKIPNELGIFPNRFFTFSGRTNVWLEGLNKIKESFWIGFGFQADRLLLGTHLHNALLQALFQAGILGFTFFFIAMIMVCKQIILVLKRMRHLPCEHKSLVIQVTGVLIFLIVRGLTESSGAFYGIDWFLMAPPIMYIQLIISRQCHMNRDLIISEDAK